MIGLRFPPRIRFSLRTFFLTLFVLSVIGSNLYVSWKWRLAQGEVQRLREELRVLTIDDPSRFYVRFDRMSEELTWRWRIYVPPGTFDVHLGGGGVPLKGTRVTGGSSSSPGIAGTPVSSAIGRRARYRLWIPTAAPAGRGGVG